MTTVQVASRIHRMRRRKNRLPLATQKALGFDITGKRIYCYALALNGVGWEQLAICRFLLRGEQKIK